MLGLCLHAYTATEYFPTSPASERPMLTSVVPDAVPVVARQQKWAPVAREPPLLPPSQQPGGDGCRGAGGFPWLTTAGLAYLTFSSGMALHRSRGDPGAVAFVASAYVDVVLLLCCLRMYERAEPGSAIRDWLKLAAWLLTAALTLLFSCKVAAVMPPAVAALVWFMGLATVAGGFAALICFNTRQETAIQKTLHNHAQSSPPPSFLALHLKQISGATRWPPPSLDLSSLNAHKPVEPRVCGVISP